jgi:Leucine-rich repeat (LRR) protein
MLSKKKTIYAHKRTLVRQYHLLSVNITAVSECTCIKTVNLVICNTFCRLLNGNQLSGILPDEIGNLQNLNRLQVDQNQLFGPIPKSFANLRSVKHL